MDKKFHILKPLEAVVIGLILLGSIAAMIIMNRPGGGAKIAVISCGELRHELSLGKDGVFRFDGFDNAEFEVKAGKIRLVNASCRDKICEKTGFIGSSGQSIICVPGRITVVISGADKGADAVVG